MDKHMKASDVFNSHQPFYGEKSTFAKAFPTIEKLTVEVTEVPSHFSPGGKSVYDEKSVGEFVNCTNTQCYNGGFKLGSIVREMVHVKQAEWSGSKRCQGYEGSPKGRKRYRSCWHDFEISIAITYRDSTVPAAQG